MIELILGGIKSGKSRLAEKRATASGLDVIYIATALKEYAGKIDEEMQRRINHHQNQRPQHWTTIEEPLKLADCILAHNKKDQCLLVDCLTLWLTNLLLDNDSNTLQNEINKLLTSLEQFHGHLIFVSNETSMGIIPESSLARQFCDEAGLLHQAIAEKSDNVVLTIAGLPHPLKGQ